MRSLDFEVGDNERDRSINSTLSSSTVSHLDTCSVVQTDTQLFNLHEL